jgi:hypothetical protein
MQRGKQYIRAIRMYYKKNNAYPPNIDALIKPSNAIGIRYLRKRYADPTTGKDEWKPIHFGQNKAPTAMGFFGQPLGGSTLAGIGSGGAGNIAGASAAGSSFMSGNSTTGTNGASNAAGGTAGTTTDGSAASGSTTNGNSSTGGDSAFGSSGQTFGGLGIIGFSPNSPKASILIYKTKSHYNEWEFVYDPIVERMMLGGMSGAGSGGVPAGNLGNGLTGTGSTGTGTTGTSISPTPQLPQQ